MPPRRAAATKASATLKRERSSSLSDAESASPPPKAAAKRSTPKAAKTKAAKAEEDDEPAKKKRAPAKSKWPPPGLELDSHPARAGYPVYQFPTRPATPNGGLRPETAYSLPLMVGAHTSIAGGVAGALLRANKAGANGVALFMKGARQWRAKPFEPEVIERFLENVKPKDDGGMGYGPESILVHGNYLINLGNPDAAKWENAYECFRDDIARCHQLGIKLYNWHTVGQCTKEESYALVAKAINRVHKDVPEVITVIENMANAGSNILGTTFHDLASMIALVEDKTRVRVCLDTCHLFAAGYDLRTDAAYAETMRKFEAEVGNHYLGGVHLNDSKEVLGGNRDLHENIGLGEIGLSGFRALMRDPLMAGIPLILETPSGAGGGGETGDLSVWTKEIALLYEIQGVPDDEWAEKSVEIEKRWRKERDALNPPKDKKGPKKGKKKAQDSDEDDD
ncbi:DNA-(apurinic or apyrimidinic site) lyase [Vanrija albida]|uniref:DNA-(Apurinic or apyrimidinic site) lyase n=1 Tax=Vanrija albida TaxID=181172 RepID=A0ABR3QDT2_9TREE